MRALVLALALAGGCSPLTWTNGVPNFREVDAGELYSVGCPTKPGWDWLRNVKHVRTYLKLTYETECSAGYAESIGIKVLRVEFAPASLGDVLGGPTQDQLHQVAAVLDDRSLYPMAYGCLHNQDRGSTATGVHRLAHGVSKDAAFAEMLAHHFHRALLGLVRAWKAYEP